MQNSSQCLKTIFYTFLFSALFISLTGCGKSKSDAWYRGEIPSAPSGLTATASSSTQINLSWNAATDDIEVTKYLIYYAEGPLIQEATTTSTSVGSLSPETQYCFRVSAQDADGNESDQSEQACATTLSGSQGLTAENAPQAAAAVRTSLDLPAALNDIALQAGIIINRAIISGSFDLFTFDMKKNFKSFQRRDMIKKQTSISKASTSKTSVVRISETLPDTTIECFEGSPERGSATLTNTTYSENEFAEIINASSTISFNNCQSLSTNTTLNGTLQITTQGYLYSPTDTALSATNFSYIDTSADDNLTFANTNIDINDITYDFFDLPMAYTLLMNGSITGTVDGDPTNAAYENYQITYNQEEFGETYSVSGNMTPSCLGFLVSTNTNTLIFISWEDICPTAGEISITQDDNTAKISIASNQQITVYFNDTQVQTFTDCEEGNDLCGN